MELQELRRIAGKYGINPAGMAKPELVRAIQRAEGVSDCFGCAEAEYCDEEGCRWREDCAFEAVSAQAAV